MKKIISLYLTLCITITMFSTLALNVYAESGTCGDNISWKIENNVLTFSGTGKMADYTNKFSPFEDLTFNTVVFENGITYIGDRILYGCEQVKNIAISDSVKEIGDEAFAMTSITDINMPDSVVAIGTEVFYGCNRLSTVTLSNNLVYIPRETFYNCMLLKEIVIPDKVAQIAQLAFAGTLLENITIPQNTLVIGKEAFAVESDMGWIVNNNEYTGIKNIYYGGTEEQWNNIKIIPGTEYKVYSTGNDELNKAAMHYNCNNISSGKCGDDATWEVKNKTLIVSGNGKTDDYASWERGWSYPIWLTCDYNTIRINDGISHIGMYAFDEMVTSLSPYDSWGLWYEDDDADSLGMNWMDTAYNSEAYFTIDKVTAVIIPKSVTFISNGAFNTCNRLTDIYYEGTEADWNNIEIQTDNKALDDATIHYNSSNGNKDFADVRFEDKFFEYDGDEKEILISGTLPENASVNYNNNKASEAGIYNATAVISAESYNTLTLSAVMTIGFKVNDVILPLEGYEIGKPWDNCWTFAYEIYEKIWNTDDGDNLLRSLELEDRKITEKNTRNFILSSEVGANIRLEDGNDENIHSLILANKDSDGFTVYHGNYNGGIYFTHYTYSEFAEHYADYKYFEYITYPNAPEYSKAPQYITVDDIPAKNYGDADFNLAVNKDTTSNLENFTYESSNENVATVDNTGKVTIKGAGEAEISVTEAGNEDYAQTTVKKTLTVAKKALNIKVDNISITYGDEINTNITYTGFIDGEDENVLTKDVEVGGYSAKPNVGEYDIILSGAEAANYEISYANAKLTVNKKDVTVTQLKVFDKVADTTTDATINTSSLVIDGMILGDDVTINFENAEATFATAEVGTDIVVAITALELVGIHAENYNLTNAEIVTTASIKETITASDIAAQITALSVVKDSTEITLPNVPVGYKIAVKSSDNEAVVKTDRSVAPVENDTQVGLILTVTNEVDETDIANTAVINVTVPASTKINVTVTAGANGTVTGSGKYLKNSGITVVATPDSGYKFSGWYNGETSVSASDSYTFKATDDISLVAKFTRKSSGGGGTSAGSYIIKFETNGGNKVSNKSVRRNNILAEPIAPTKDGFTFEGWYTDKNLTAKYDFSAKVTKGFTLYAKWEDIKKSQIILTIGEKEALVLGETKENDVSPKIVNNRTMLPIRFIAEALGAEVAWNGLERKVTIVKDDTEIIITIDSDKAIVNGKTVTLDSSAFIESDRTYLPLRFISENLGAKVEWVEDTQQVIITK